MFWRNGYQNNRNSYQNNNRNSYNDRTPVPAWSTSRNGQPVQRLQQMLLQAQQTHANQGNQQNTLQNQSSQPQPVPQLNQPQAQQQMPQPQQHSQAQPEQNRQQYYDPSVSFEPMSEDLLKLIGQNKEAAKEAAPGVEPPLLKDDKLEEPVTLRAADKEIPQSLFKNPYLPQSLSTEILSELMQGEQNGLAFYQYVATKITDDKAKNTLLRISDENMRRIAVLNELHKDITGKSFEPQKFKIELNANFRTCIRVAIAEESTLIEKIITILETEKNAKMELMLYRKLNNVNLLIAML